MPRMQAVDSSVVEAVGYDARGRRLHVRFLDRGLYVYQDVEPELFEALLAAPSKGEFVNREVKPRGFSYERLD